MHAKYHNIINNINFFMLEIQQILNIYTTNNVEVSTPLDLKKKI